MNEDTTNLNLFAEPAPQGSAPSVEAGSAPTGTTLQLSKARVTAKELKEVLIAWPWLRPYGGLNFISPGKTRKPRPCQFARGAAFFESIAFWRPGL